MKKAFLLLGILVAFAASVAAQNNFQDLSADGRSRVVSDDKATARISVNVADIERTAFELINQKRAANGLAPLAWSDDVAFIAREHSQNMATQNFFSHRGLDNKMVSDRADDHGMKKWRAIGENIAFNRGYADPVAKAVDLWLSSPSHYHNLMGNDWKESAVGIAVAPDGSYYFTQVFLRR